MVKTSNSKSNVWDDRRSKTADFEMSLSKTGCDNRMMVSLRFLTGAIEIYIGLKGRDDSVFYADAQVRSR